jgi:hypothetical protein
MSITVTASTSVVLVNTTSATNTVLLPYLSSVGRLITIRDNTGYAQNSTITITTTGGAVFYDGTTSITINQPFGFVTLSVLSGGNYALLNTFAFPAGNAAASVGTLTTSNILLNDRGTSNYYPFYSSNASLYFISTPIGDVTLADLTSTVNGLGSVGYLSSLIVPVIPTYIAVGATSNQVNGIRSPLGSIIYSLTNGSSWTNAGGTGGFLTQGWDVAYNNGFYVACGDNSDGITPTTPGHLQYSADGTTWVYSATALGSNQARSRVIYANGLWHSVGSNSTTTGGAYAVVYSANGKNWFPSVTSPQFPAQATGIAFGAGVWVYTASNVGSPQRSVQWSLDGSNWNAATSVSWVNGQAGDVAYDGYRFVVVVSGGTNPNASNLSYSFDGSNWTGLGITGGNLNFAGPVQAALSTQPNTSNWLLTPYPGATVGFGQLIKRSIIGGTAWLSNTNVSGYYRITRPYYDGTKWWAGFQTQPFGTTQTSTDQAMYYSFDGGQTWENSAITGGFSNGGYPNGFVVSPPTIDYGLQLQSTVTGLEQQFTTGLLTVLGPQNVRDQWVAVGTNATALGTIKYSSDGINWSSSVSGGFSTRGKGVTYSGSLWVAVGDVGAFGNPLASAQYSIDGSNWSNAESGLTTTELEGVAYNGSLFVACGNGGFFYSFSGSNWYNANASVFPSGRPYGVAWNGYMWVAVGQSGNASNIAYSMDGSNWSNASSGFFQVSGQGVAWNTRYWVAVGDQTTDAKTALKYSYDGLNWSNSIFGGFGDPAGTGNSVTWNGNLWVAAGISGGFTQSNIQYSTDGSNWFRSATNTFTGAGTNGGAGIATNGNRFVAVGESADGNTILYSDDGSNWSPGTGALFSDYGLAIAYSLYGTADITLNNLGFYTKGQDTFLTSTHTIATTDDVMNIDNTLYIDRPNRRVGILTSTPTVALDVNGTLKTTTLDTVNLINNVQVIDSMTMQGPLLAPNIYVATGFSNASGTLSNQCLKWSYDGVNWNNNVTGGFIFTYSVPVYGTRCNLWVAAGSNPSATSNAALAIVQWSSDGSNWNNATSGDFTGLYGTSPNAVVLAGPNYVFTAGNGFGVTIYFSTDGKVWNNSSNISRSSNFFWNDGGGNAIGYGGLFMSNTNVTVMAGSGQNAPALFSNVYYSTDYGSNWQYINSNLDTSEDVTIFTATTNQSKTLFAGIAGGGGVINRMYASTDGSNVYTITTDFSGYYPTGGNGLYYAGGIWFFTQNNLNTTNKLYYSSNDGSNWYAVARTSFSPNITSGGAAEVVTYDGILWYCGADTGYLYSSSNLTNWYATTTTQLYAQVAVGVTSAFGNAAIINKIITNSIGVGNNNPQYAVDITGQLRVTSTILAQAGVLSNGVYLTSDSNVKENIVIANYNLCYSNVKDLELKRFRFISSYAVTKQDQTQLGFLAQEVQQVFPKSVIELPGLNYGPPTLHLNTDQIFMTQYGATRYLMDVVETQNATISTLLSQVDQMRDRVVRYSGGI